MDDSSIFIAGGNGQLGQALKARYPRSVSIDKDELDISNAESVNNFDWGKVKILLNTAAYTNVDEAESSEGRIAAWNVNAYALANLVRVAMKRDIIMVHISTDYVFDGTQTPHTEEEPLSPLGVYGQTKAAGDVVVSLLPKHYLLRSSWVIGEGKNFVRTMLELGKKGVNPTVVADQVGRLTFTSELVRAIDHLLTTQATYGTYNLSNSGETTSWADIARAIFMQAGYNLTVTDTTTAEYFANKPSSAPRPLHSTLALDKIQATEFKSIDWHEDLAKYIAKEIKV